MATSYNELEISGEKTNKKNSRIRLINLQILK